MKKWLKKKFKNERGLTLVELLAVIVILAIVAVIAFVMIGKVIGNSKQDAHIANAQQLIASAKLYDSQGGEFDKNNQVTDDKLRAEGLIDELINPWDSTAEYKGTVTKTSDENGVIKYTVTITGQKIPCNIQDRDEKALAKGRNEICN